MLNENERTVIKKILTLHDINDIKRAILENDDCSYLSAVINGEGYKPLNQCTDDELLIEFKERFHSDLLDDNLPEYIYKGFAQDMINLV